MNGRQARARRRMERAQLEAMAAAIRAATPLYVRTEDDEEWWKVGPVHFNTPIIREDYPPELKSALMVRRQALFSGECACGARWEMKPGGRITHAAECVASDESLLRTAGAAGIEAGREPRED